MSAWIEIPIIVLTVAIASFYVYRRVSASLRKGDTLDCPFAEDCSGCNCQAPELKDECEKADNPASCGCS